MKNIIKLLLLLIYNYSFAQSPVIGYESWDGSDLPNGAYLKDANNRQDLYVGKGSTFRGTLR